MTETKVRVGNKTQGRPENYAELAAGLRAKLDAWIALGQPIMVATSTQGQVYIENLGPREFPLNVANASLGAELQLVPPSPNAGIIAATALRAALEARPLALGQAMTKVGIAPSNQPDAGSAIMDVLASLAEALPPSPATEGSALGQT